MTNENDFLAQLLASATALHNEASVAEEETPVANTHLEEAKAELAAHLANTPKQCKSGRWVREWQRTLRFLKDEVKHYEGK